MKKIISMSLIILISNYSFSCYSSQQVSAEETLIYDGERIESVITNDDREIKFLSNSGRYISELRAITGRASVVQPGDTLGVALVSIDDVMLVKVKKFDGVKTIAATALIILISTVALYALVSDALHDDFEIGASP